MLRLDIGSASIDLCRRVVRQFELCGGVDGVVGNQSEVVVGATGEGGGVDGRGDGAVDDPTQQVDTVLRDDGLGL